MQKDQFIASLETAVPVRRSLEQIQRLVERFGAAQFMISYDAAGEPAAVSFQVRDPHVTDVLMPVALRAPSDVIYAALRARRRHAWSLTDAQKLAMREQANRVAWRNLHDFVRASLIGVQTGIMTLGEAFMANLVVTLPTGEARRLGEIAAGGGLLKPSGGGGLLLGSGV